MPQKTLKLKSGQSGKSGKYAKHHTALMLFIQSD